MNAIGPRHFREPVARVSLFDLVRWCLFLFIRALDMSRQMDTPILKCAVVLAAYDAKYNILSGTGLV